MTWLYDTVRRVPKISDKQIAKMRHIEPVLKLPDSVFYRRIAGADKIDPRNVSCIWNAVPIGEEFAFDSLNCAKIITQHESAMFFKPSLAEVYAWMLVQIPTDWEKFKFFHLGEAHRFPGSTDCYCVCEVLGGDVLVKDVPFRTASGFIGHTLVKKV